MSKRDSHHVVQSMSSHRPASISRRDFCVAASAGLVVAKSTLASRGDRPGPPQIGAFVKFIQELPYDALSEQLAEIGFTGIEATVRRGGLVEPDRVEDDLPRLVEALKKVGLKIHVMASDVNRADDPQSARVLRTAAKLGVPRYRMKYYRYDLEKPIRPQLVELAATLQDLVQLNKQLGIQAVYQNHAGREIVGSTVWDIEQLVRKHPLEHIGIAFDIRHATVEAGQSWLTLFRVAEPHLGIIYVKDFRWTDERPENVALGQGRIDPKFFQIVKDSSFRGPFSLHIEYLGKAGLQKNLQALRDDLKTLKSWLA
ncbi:MAG TPA: sugar phosphate isomerase/epimerase [Planctomycetaceae bacterium]|nr:sugar phosphate isomerase/epimerase [Planctomycetaceae bacterium]